MEIMQERFEAWLDSQPDDRKIDLTKCDACLMSSFIRENTNHCEAISSWTHWAPSMGEYIKNECFPFPPWAVRLIDPLSRVIEYMVNNETADGYSGCYTCAQLKARYNRLFNQPKQELPQLKTNKCEALILNQC